MVIGLMIHLLFFPTCQVQWRTDLSFVLFHRQNFGNMVIGDGDQFIDLFVIASFFPFSILLLIGTVFWSERCAFVG